jgi:hypothetical protein
MHRNDNFEDKILDDLFIDSMKDLYDSKDISHDAPVQPSPEFLTSMDTMFQSEYKKIAKQRRRRMLPRIAAVIALFFITGLLSISRVTAWKEPLYNFFFQPSADGDKSKVNIEEIEEDDEFQKFLPEYVPEGFELTESFYNEELQQKQFIFKYNDKFINISILSSEFEIYENLNNYKKITYNGRVYYSNGNSLFTWRYRNYTFTFDSNLSKSECLKIINSIK